jgi:flagellar hook assembly protein FlgD
MIFEEDVDEFFFDQGRSVLDGDTGAIAIVFPEEGNRLPVTLTWNGTGLTGEPLSNGAYIVKVESVDSLGITTVVTGTATILRAVDLATVRIYNEAGELVYSRQQAAGSLQQSDVEVQGSVVDPGLPAGSPGSAIAFRLGSQVLTWNGTDAAGRPLANGSYLVEITLESGSQQSVITETVTVLSSGQQAAGSVQLNPNPVAGEGPVEIRAGSPASSVVQIRVRAYTLAAELVRTLENGSDSVLWDLRDATGSPVSAGFYLLAVESRDSTGAWTRTLARLAVIR